MINVKVQNYHLKRWESGRNNLEINALVSRHTSSELKCADAVAMAC